MCLTGPIHIHDKINRLYWVVETPVCGSVVNWFSLCLNPHNLMEPYNRIKTCGLAFIWNTHDILPHSTLGISASGDKAPWPGRGSHSSDQSTGSLLTILAKEKSVWELKIILQKITLNIPRIWTWSFQILLPRGYIIYDLHGFKQECTPTPILILFCCWYLYRSFQSLSAKQEWTIGLSTTIDRVCLGTLSPNPTDPGRC
jgi:hypothetical protein